MPLDEKFSKEEVAAAVTELKAIIEDAERNSSFDGLNRVLPRLAHAFESDPVLRQGLLELPQVQATNHVEIEELLQELYSGRPVEPKARLAVLISILCAIGKGKLDLWDWSNSSMRYARPDFWNEIFHPAARDILNHFNFLQRELNVRIKAGGGALPKQGNEVKKKFSLDLFISHSSKDKKLAKALIEFLREALAIPHDKVRCTSVDGYKLSGGAKTEEKLNAEIKSSRCFIGLITPESLKSQFVLFELGARWGSGLNLTPLLGAGLPASTLRPPLSGMNAQDCASKADMQQLVHDLAGELGRQAPPLPVYEKTLRNLLKRASESSAKTK